MSALLRVLGFLPALVHMAWAQVSLAKGQHADSRITARASPWWLGIGAFACVIILGLSCAVALYHDWLDPRWDGLWLYIAPLVLWQGSACLSAAFAHRPFQTHSESQYSLFCMFISAAQITALIIPFTFASTINISAHAHISFIGLTSSLGFISISAWMARLK